MKNWNFFQIQIPDFIETNVRDILNDQIDIKEYT